MYRFLLTPRWLGYLAVTLIAAVVMVELGNWQLDRYRARSEINARIDAADHAVPVELPQALPRPGGEPGTVGPPPSGEAEWTRVTVTGRYDTANTVLVRNRSVNGRVGFEVLVPLVLTDGPAVLVSRGWVPPPAGAGAMVQPDVPEPPVGEVTVVGRLRRPNQAEDPVTREHGLLETRRIALASIAAHLPYPIYGGYVMLDTEDPPASTALVPIPVRHENSWQNLGYVAQWWIFAGMTLVGFGWFAHREARERQQANRADQHRVDRTDRVDTDRVNGHR